MSSMHPRCDFTPGMPFGSAFYEGTETEKAKTPARYSEKGFIDRRHPAPLTVLVCKKVGGNGIHQHPGNEGGGRGRTFMIFVLGCLSSLMP